MDSNITFEELTVTKTYQRIDPQVLSSEVYLSRKQMRRNGKSLINGLITIYSYNVIVHADGEISLSIIMERGKDVITPYRNPTSFLNTLSEMKNKYSILHGDIDISNSVLIGDELKLIDFGCIIPTWEVINQTQKNSSLKGFLHKQGKLPCRKAIDEAYYTSGILIAKLSVADFHLDMTPYPMSLSDDSLISEIEYVPYYTAFSDTILAQMKYNSPEWKIASKMLNGDVENSLINTHNSDFSQSEHSEKLFLIYENECDSCYIYLRLILECLSCPNADPYHIYDIFNGSWPNGRTSHSDVTNTLKMTKYLSGYYKFHKGRDDSFTTRQMTDMCYRAACSGMINVNRTLGEWNEMYQLDIEDMISYEYKMAPKRILIMTIEGGESIMNIF